MELGYKNEAVKQLLTLERHEIPLLTQSLVLEVSKKYIKDANLFSYATRCKEHKGAYYVI